jgi:hypothetical protein
MGKLSAESNQWSFPRKRQVFDPQQRYEKLKEIQKQIKPDQKLEKSGK